MVCDTEAKDYGPPFCSPDPAQGWAKPQQAQRLREERGDSLRPTVWRATDPLCVPEARGTGVHAPHDGGIGEGGGCSKVPALNGYAGETCSFPLTFLNSGQT